MSTQKAKFALFSRLQGMGFTHEEAVSLRRIEMTLQRWGEMECGDAHGRCIERDETTGKPFMTYERGTSGQRGRLAIADREAGALKRLGKIVATRNERMNTPSDHPDCVVPYHQGDCRGCNLYLLKVSDVKGDTLDSIYTRGLAVCA